MAEDNVTRISTAAVGDREQTQGRQYDSSRLHSYVCLSNDSANFHAERSTDDVPNINTCITVKQDLSAVVTHNT